LEKNYIFVSSIPKRQQSEICKLQTDSVQLTFDFESQQILVDL